MQQLRKLSELLVLSLVRRRYALTECRDTTYKKTLKRGFLGLVPSSMRWDLRRLLLNHIVTRRALIIQPVWNDLRVRWSSLHLYSLGPITYAIHEFSVEHAYYTKALGITARYPSFEDDSISGYAMWLDDLQKVLSPIFTGPEEDFIVIASRCMEEQRQQYAH